MKYINMGRVPKTYFGVTLNPNEVVDVPGKINSKNIIPVRCKINTENVEEKQKPVAKKSSTQSNKEKESDKVNG